jgi:orotidine-5'-phosphate decarboxylase
MNMDRLFDAVAARGHVCVGLDTCPDYLPPKVLAAAADPAAGVLAYNLALIDATADLAACYKVQIAYYEALGLAGLRAYAATLAELRRRGLLAIADVKRGDIADTAAQYATAHLAGEFEADFVTLAPYMGMDTLDPWLKYVESAGKGAFVLMRTSNPGMRDFEYRELAGGGRLYDAVGAKLTELAGRYAGERGYGAVGAVVGCTEPEEAAEIRARYGKLFFLIPGYGVQGGAAVDAARLLAAGNGGVVNASRSILKAWSQPRFDGEVLVAEHIDLKAAAEAARGATAKMRDAIRAACAVAPDRRSADAKK